MAKEEIFVIGLDNSQYLKAAQDTRAEIIRLNKEQKAMKGTTKETSKAYTLNSVALKENKANLRDLEKQISTANAQSRSFNSINEKTTKDLKIQGLSINELRAQNKRLLKVKNDLILTNKEEAKLAKEIDDKLNANNETIKENSDAYTQQKLNIGNYSSALSGISPQLSRAISTGQQLVTGLKAQKVALAGTSKGLKLFRIALISTGIGAIVVALGLMIGYFLKTQKAVDAMTRVLVPIKILFQTLIGVFEKLGEKMFAAFNDPKQTVIDLGNLIKKNITNRIEGLVEIFKILGSGSLDGLGEALSKTATGVENLGTKLKQFGEDSKAAIQEAIDRGNEIAQLGIDSEKSEIKLVGLRAENLRIIKEQELISKDKTKTDKERNDALDLALKKSKEIENAELAILDVKIKKMKLENESNDTDREAQLALAELEAERSQKSIENKAVELRFLGVKNQLANESAKRAADAAKKKLDQTIKDLDLELELFKENNREKLADNEDLNLAFIDAKITTLEIINQKELEALKVKNDNGLISEKEYNLKKLQLENEFADQKKELRDSLAEQEQQDKLDQLQKEREARDVEFALQLEENAIKQQTEYERKKEAEALQFENDKQILADRFLDEEITKKEHDRRLLILQKIHTDKITKIKKDSDDADAKMRKITLQQKAQAYANSFGDIAQLLGEETAAGKAAALAQAVANTYLGVANVWGSKSVLPEPMATSSKVLSTATVLGSGLSAVKKITSVNTNIPRAEDGMLIGASHRSGGINIEAEGGEAIINKRSMSDPFLRALASDINVAGGGVRFADGGFIGSSSSSSLVNDSATSMAQINDLIDRKINAIVVTNVATETIDVASDVLAVENVANL